MSGRGWERVARRQPYWGVLSHERFLTDRLDEEATGEFWASGEDHVAGVFHTLRGLVSGDTHPKVAVDFGCGVGRLLWPLARRAERAVGVDPSPTMLALARENLAQRGVDNCQLVRSLADLRAVALAYDLVHSALVFQHIRPAEGYAAFRELLVGLTSGGCGIVQVKIRLSPRVRQIIRYLRARSRMLGGLSVIVKRLPREAALIDVYEYDMDRLLLLLNQAGITEVTVNTAAGNARDVTLFFCKP